MPAAAAGSLDHPLHQQSPKLSLTFHLFLSYSATSPSSTSSNTISSLSQNRLEDIQAPSTPALIMTRTEKRNDRNHTGLADGTASAEDHLPRYFAKSGPTDADPRGVKKQGSGRGNWGKVGAEMNDYGYTFTNSRRRSNSSTQGLGDFKTKFETVDQEPVFEEGVHGPSRTDTEESNPLEKEESTDTSTLAGSVDEEDGTKKV